MGWLLTGEGEMNKPGAADGRGAASAPPREKDEPRPEKRRRMRIYLESVSAGKGNYLFGEGYETFTFKSSEIPAGAEFGLRVVGDSMEPEIAEGSIIWIKPGIVLEDGDVGIFILNGQSLCKRLRLDRERRIAELVSTNPAYPPIVLDPKDSFFILGRVLQ